jgi:hypothetical protein
MVPPLDAGRKNAAGGMANSVPEGESCENLRFSVVFAWWAQKEKSHNCMVLNWSV